MARSDLLKFWKLLSDAGLTGSPSKLTEDDVQLWCGLGQGE
jgi:hypothetical protein